MPTGPALPAAFFARPCLEVAPALLGAYLVHRLADGDVLVGRIVEVEAYLGDGSDPASHGHRGPTPRNCSMFGPPGRLYAYRSYGIHTCANVVCEPAGSCAAVLLRALEPVAGIARMRARRRLPRGAPDRDIARGPGRLAQAMGISLADDGRSLLRGPLCLRGAAAGDPAVAVETSRRIGLGRGRELPYRFSIRANPWVSRGDGVAIPDSQLR